MRVIPFADRCSFCDKRLPDRWTSQPRTLDCSSALSFPGPCETMKLSAFAKHPRKAMSNRPIAAPFVEVPEALAEIRAGRMLIVVDDEDRENEGDLTLAAEFVTPEAINFMARFGRGLICLTLTEERADYLRLGPMTQENTSRFGTAFTESIEAREGVTTGISAADRAHTIKVAIDPKSTAHDL